MRPFSQVDVFTDELGLGNPVAVVHDADSLTDEQMAAFARWTNLSETTFLLAPADPSADYRLRIFTTARELPFAGHPTLGSARAWLDAGGRPKGADLVQECGAGLVRIRRDADRLAFAAPPLLRGGPVDEQDVADTVSALRIDPALVRGAQWADNGPGWLALLLPDAAAVLAVDPDRTAVGNVGVVGPHPAGGPADFEVRAFTPVVPSGEDPVTGSLNAAIAQWLIPAGLAPSSYTARQGTVLQRSGTVHLSQENGDIWVGGATVPGVRGTVSL
jgi:PhzF family phenazine biosynthesis protein